MWNFWQCFQNNRSVAAKEFLSSQTGPDHLHGSAWLGLLQPIIVSSGQKNECFFILLLRILISTATDGFSSIDSTATRIFISSSFFFHSTSCGLNLFNFNPSSFCAIIIVIIGIQPSYINLYLLVKDFQKPPRANLCVHLNYK